MNFDLNNLKFDSPVATSAKQLSEISREWVQSQEAIVEARREAEEREATLVAGAEASIEQKELLQQQLEFICEQNALLCDNYEKLKEMYEAQVQENTDAKDELKRSRRYSGWMMVVSVVSMLAAIASTVIPFLCEQLK